MVSVVFSTWWLAGAVAAVLTASDALAQSRVTFNRDVAPIVFEHCVTCHRPGQIGPFSLLAYGDVRPRAAAIVRAVRSRSMPPWKPEPGYGPELVGARRLTDQQIDTIVRWVDDGAGEGDPADLPSAPAVADGWRLGQPDLVVRLAEPYVLHAGRADILRNVVIPVPLPAARYVRGLEFRPGNPRVVHHANIRVDRAGSSRRLDGLDGEPGFDGQITTANFPEGQFLGWTPGQVPPLAPRGLAWRLDANADFVVQLHLLPGDQDELVQPSIGLYFADEPPARTPLMLRLGSHDIDIPPGQSDYRTEDSYVLPVDVEVTALQPHAHRRATDIRGFAVLPDGTRTGLIMIKDLDFDWQDLYRLATPLALPRGTKLAMEYRYDNSAANRRNPDRPPARVRWGEKSSDEMGDLWIQVVARTDEERGRLLADFGPKVMAADAAGYEKMLEVDPGNARLHEAVAAIDLLLNKTDPAIAHLGEALRINPDSAEAHYNLATAQIGLGRLAEAERHLRRALEIQPGFAAALVNLGAVLRRDGRLDEAIARLREALRLAPDSAAAHANLGGAYAAQRRLADAVAEYRLALQLNPELLEPTTDLAWILATSPDPAIRRTAEAVRLAERAAALTERRSVRALDTLGAAYAALGDFDRATSAVLSAIELVQAGPAGEENLRTLRARLELYRGHTALVER